MYYGICSFILKSSERYCLVIDRKSKIPSYYPNLFITTQVRSNSKSISTMIYTANTLALLLNFLKDRKIDLQERILTGIFLSVSEIEDLKNYTQKKVMLNNKIKKDRVYISSEVQYTRLTIIYKYIDWLSLHLINNPSEAVLDRLKNCTNNIKESRPRKKGRNGNLKDKALSEEEIEVLFEITRLNSPLNPFKKDVQKRNRLIILMLYYLGVRGGELLNIKISDINFSSNILSVVRRADDKTDSRINQPLVKTKDRLIPVQDSLIKEIHSYILNERNSVSKNKKHDYLFVTHKEGGNLGLPLRSESYYKVIRTIRSVSPNLILLTGHMLRHTWNDEFSKRMDSMDNAPSEERQEQLRAYLMGWKEGSGTASTYNKRFIRKSAHEAALLLQQDLGKTKNA